MNTKDRKNENDTTVAENRAGVSQTEEQEYILRNDNQDQVQVRTTVPTEELHQNIDIGTEEGKKPLTKRAASVINRLTNVDSVKTGKGLRKLKNDTKSIVGEIDVEVSLEKEAAKGGDVVEVLASGQAVASWEGKLEKLNDGFNSINSRAEYLSKDSSSS